MPGSARNKSDSQIRKMRALFFRTSSFSRLQSRVWSFSSLARLPRRTKKKERQLAFLEELYSSDGTGIKQIIKVTKSVLLQSFAEYLTIDSPIRALCWHKLRGNAGDEGRVWLGLTSVWFSITTIFKARKTRNQIVVYLLPKTPDSFYLSCSRGVNFKHTLLVF